MNLLAGFTVLNSSAIAAFRYESITASLDIHFRNGACYRYRNVPAATVHAFIQAHSHGRFFHLSIRNAFPCVRII
jgi:hypothetical protein